MQATTGRCTCAERTSTERPRRRRRWRKVWLPRRSATSTLSCTMKFTNGLTSASIISDVPQLLNRPSNFGYFFPSAGLFLWFFWRYFRIAQDIFLKLHANNYLIEDTMEQLLCEKCNRWVTGRVGRMKGFCYLVGFDDVRMRMCRFDWTGSWRIVSWKGRAHCAATTTPGATSVTNAESWSTPSSWSGRDANFARRPRSSSTRSTSSWTCPRRVLNQILKISN